MSTKEVVQKHKKCKKKKKLTKKTPFYFSLTEHKKEYLHKYTTNLNGQKPPGFS